jgi:UDP-N-acetylmuramate dehydrogenase
MTSLESLTSDRQSTFRTEHDFEAFAEFASVEEFRGLVEASRAAGRQIMVLGNGSNTLFLNRKVRTAVLRNKLAREMEVLGDGSVRASSSLMISAILKHCRANKLDSFYYLASVPATVGGALAMNAGRGKHHNMTIYDFVQSVTWYEDGKVQTVDVGKIEREYRWTPFTGKTPKLILEATFYFPPTDDDDDKIAERVQYSKEVQDHSAGNCGSVFKQASLRILKWVKGLRFGTARYSPKTDNWILSTGKSSKPIVVLIRFVQAIHRLVGSKCAVEFIEVD